MARRRPAAASTARNPRSDGRWRARLREASPFLISLSAHGLAAMLALTTVAPLPPPEDRTAAIMVVLEPEPQVPDVEDAAMPPPEADSLYEAFDLARLEPDDGAVRAEITGPVAEDIAPSVDEAEIPLPTPRPDPPEQPTGKAEPQPPERETPVMTETAAPTLMAFQDDESHRNSARERAPGRSIDSASTDRWQAKLVAHLERRKRYPATARGGREEGTALVRFQVDRGGNVLAAELVQSSGFGALDEEAVDLVRRASPVPKPPADMTRPVTVPIRFNFR